MNGLVTVVVPVYNAEKYLDRCVNSIVNQTYPLLEILLIDDGSADHSPFLCDEWAKRDTRIQVIHKQNAGAGLARNTGIEHATGEFICFFDSDDALEHNLIEVCLTKMRETNADIVCYGNDVLFSDGVRKETRIPTPPKMLFEGAEVRQKLLPKLISYDPRTGENWNLNLCVWCTMISMALIKKSGWIFVSEREIFSEDFYSMLNLYCYAHKVAILNKVLYHYYETPLSLSHSFNEARHQNVMKFPFEVTRLVEQIDCEVGVEISAMFVGLFIGELKQIVNCREPLRKKLQYISEMIRDRFWQEKFKAEHFSKESITKRMLFWTIQHKSSLMCYMLVALRNMKGNLK